MDPREVPPYRAFALGPMPPRARRRRSLLCVTFLTASTIAAPGISQAQAADEPTRRLQPTPPSGARSDPSPGEIGTAGEEPTTPSPSATDSTEKEKKLEVAGKEEAVKPKAEPPPLVEGGTTSPKRTPPDYDGRGEPPTTAADVALWIPRALLSPLYLVSEFVVRRPLGWLIATAEREQWPSAIRNFFLFGPEKKAGIVPTAFLDFGLRASVGIYAFWDDLFIRGNHLRLHATTLGLDWLQGAIADKVPLGNNATVDFRVDGTHRPDNVFHGLGPSSLQDERTRFGIDRVQAHPVFEMQWWRGSRILTETGIKSVDFREDRCCHDPSLSLALREGRFGGAAPPGYERGYTSVYQRGEVTLDTREERPAAQSGVRVEIEVEHGSNVRRTNDSWLRYGGTIGGLLDVKNNRTVGLSVTTLFVDPVSQGAEIPFTEQIVLGGNGPMRGYLYGRMIDRSAAIATLKYKWPIWVFLDGTIQFATGNVFGPQLEDFSTRLLRLSGAMGVESIGSPDHTFELLAGFGTETFEHGAEVNSFRLLFGTNRGF